MNEPKYQWSKFGGPDRNEQYVVREDDFEVFKNARQSIMTEFFSSPTTPNEWQPKPARQRLGIMSAPETGSEKPSAQEMADATPAGDTGLKCMTCGQPAIEKRGVSAKGKKWHALFCSSEDKSHVQWL